MPKTSKADFYTTGGVKSATKRKCVLGLEAPISAMVANGIDESFLDVTYLVKTKRNAQEPSLSVQVGRSSSSSEAFGCPRWPTCNSGEGVASASVVLLARSTELDAKVAEGEVCTDRRRNKFA